MRWKTGIFSFLMICVLLLSLAPAAMAAGSKAQAAAETLYTLGLLRGTRADADGMPDYDLDRAPSRQEAVTMLVRLLGKEKEAESGAWRTPFTDVDGWAEPCVGYAYAGGLVKGTGETTFGGRQTIGASEYLTMVLRAMGYSSGTDFAWDSAWTLSDELGVTDGSYGAGTKTFLRADLAVVSLGALSAQMKGGTVTLAESLGVRLPERELRVHFLDVGQADCILAESEGHFLLIDAGNNADGDAVTSYLAEQGVSELDYVIGTHPHEDHIGGLDDAIEEFPVGCLILPPKETATQTFEELLDAAEAKNLALTAPVVGSTYALGDAFFTILAPNTDYGDDLNDWSVGIRLSCGSNAFVLCGDAERTAEADMLKNGQTLRADVLKVSHHGSATSTTQAFLDAVDPTWAVISCGRDNPYGHPDAQTLNRLADAGVGVFRTDEQGTVVAQSDGTEITWSAAPVADPASNPGSTLSGDVQTDNTEGQPEVRYVLNTGTMVFHDPSCRYVRAISEQNYEQTDRSREALIAAGYSPCGVCKP